MIHIKQKTLQGPRAPERGRSRPSRRAKRRWQNSNHPGATRETQQHRKPAGLKGRHKGGQAEAGHEAESQSAMQDKLDTKLIREQTN